MVQSLPRSDGFRILFNSPELVEVQRSSFHLFLKKGIAEELSKISCIQLKDAHFSISIVIDAQNFRLVTPENSYRDCIVRMKSYTCKLYVQTKIYFKDKLSGELLYTTSPEWVLLADLPIMTKRGHFVINGSPRVIVHQVGRAPGVYFKKVLKPRKENTTARFYGDIIPRKGVWVRLQINKKGEIELKLKKGKKVRAEMVKKCLQLLEKERSAIPLLQETESSIPTDHSKEVFKLNEDILKDVSVSGYQFKMGTQKSSVNLQEDSRRVKNTKEIGSVREEIVSPFLLRENYAYSHDLDVLGDGRIYGTAITGSTFQLALVNSCSSFTGIRTDNCVYSKTRRTQAFVTGRAINKPNPVLHPIKYDTRPWSVLVKEGTTRKKPISQLKKVFSFGASNTVLQDRLLSNGYSQSSFDLFRQIAKKESSQSKADLVSKSDWIETVNSSPDKTLRTIGSNRVYKTKQTHAKRSFARNQTQSKHNFVFASLSKVKEPTSVFTDVLLGSKLYGKKRSDFTKAEREAFINVYATFYKNEIQDTKERVSTPVDKRSQSILKDSLKSSIFPETKRSAHSTTKLVTKLSRRRTKKQEISHNLEKGYKALRDSLYQLFKRSETYDLGAVGREKINKRFGISVIETQLTSLDIKETINWLSLLREGKKEIDDIDHSQNRRVRTSSELLQAQLEIGITRLKSFVTKKVRTGIGRYAFGYVATKHKAFLDSSSENNWLSAKTGHKRVRSGDANSSQSTDLCVNTEFLHPRYFTNGKVSKLLTTRKTAFLPRVTTNLIVRSGRNQQYSKGGTSCFIKKSAFIDTIRLDLKSRTNFTSSNPFCIFFVLEKKKWSLLKAFHQKLDFQNASTKALKGISNNSKNELFLNARHRSRKEALNRETVQVPKFLASELFSTKPINGALREFLGSSPLSQYMDQTNPLADITHKRRISSLGVGGVSRESAGMAIRGIHPTHYGRICPIETPEGKNAGLVNSLALYAKINNKGFIETPYYQVRKGQVQHELGFSFYSAEQESQNHFYIAPYDIKQSQNKLLASNVSTLESIPVRVADTVLDLFKKVSPYQVNCIGVSPVQILSVATSLIPFLEHNDANRALMGSNMQRQAVSLMISERPLVGTGLEARILAESGHLVQSKVSGFVSSVSADQIVVERLLHDLIEKPFPAFYTNHFVRTDSKLPAFAFSKQRYTKAFTTTKSYTPKFGLYDKAMNPCAFLQTHSQNGVECESTIQDKTVVLTNTAKSQNCFFLQNQIEEKKSVKAECTGLPATGFLKTDTSQRSVCISSLFTRGKAKQWSVRGITVHEEKLEDSSVTQIRSLFCDEQKKGKMKNKLTQRNKYQTFSFQTKRFAFLPVTHRINTFLRSNQETCIVQKPLVEEGDWVQKGDILSDCSAGQKGELSVGRNVLIAYIPWQGYNFEDAIVISDRLVKEQLYTSLHIERYTVTVHDCKDKIVDTNEWFTGDLPGVESKKKSHLQRSGFPFIGTILKEGDILVGKIKYSKKKPATPHERLVSDILGEHNFSLQNSSLYVPKGIHEARVLSYKIKKRFEKPLKNNLRPAGAPQVVHIFLGEKRNLQVGDKMSGRHGNKGIVSTVLPKQDMPYLADGSPIDILLNPLGVPSRMNVGQVFECLLGLASTYLHQNFKSTPFDELYGVEASQSLVFLKLYQARLQSGQNWLFQVNFPGKTRLTDGRSGECLDQWVTVGRAYILKLIHMVNEKIHARAIGPYALVTQQPLKGRAHKGGQRLGEMEVWAVQGFGAAYILQELLTKKSDDSIGRKEVLQTILPRSASFLDSTDPFGQSTQLEGGSKKETQSHNVLGQADIFKVLLCELQSLCLDVGVYSMKTESFQRTFLGVLE